MSTRLKITVEPLRCLILLVLLVGIILAAVTLSGCEEPDFSCDGLNTEDFNGVDFWWGCKLACEDAWWYNPSLCPTMVPWGDPSEISSWVTNSCEDGTCRCCCTSETGNCWLDSSIVSADYLID